MTLLRCNDCRWAGMIHCSEPEHCGGMKMPTWEETLEDLKKIQSVFISLHEIGEKNWTADQKEQAKRMRRRCVELAEYRYSLLQGKRK